MKEFSHEYLENIEEIINKFKSILKKQERFKHSLHPRLKKKN